MPPQEKFSDAIAKLIEYSVLSSSLNKIVAEDGFMTRAQLNLLIVSSFGSGKSTLFDKLEKLGLAFSVHEYTPAAVTGTIDAGGYVKPSVLIYAANKAFIIDEFQKFSKDARNALLSFMENQHYRKTIGIFLKQPDVIEGQGYKVVARDNWIETHVKCSFITGSMYFKKQTTDDIALLSRCFPIVLTMTKEDAYNLFRGLENFKIDNRIVELHEKLEGLNIKISSDVKETLIKEFDEKTKEVNFDVGFITRMLWDLARIAAVNAALKNREEITDKDVKKASNFAYYQAIGIARGALTMSEMKVLSAFIDYNEPMDAKKVAEITNLHERTVRDALNKLYSKKLLTRIFVSGKKVYIFEGKI